MKKEQNRYKRSYVFQLEDKVKGWEQKYKAAQQRIRTLNTIIMQQKDTIMRLKGEQG